MVEVDVGRRPDSPVESPSPSRSIGIPCLTGPNSAKRREIALRVVCTSLRDDGLPPSHTALPGPHGPHWTTLDQVGGGPAWSSARQPGDAPRRPETRCDRRRMPRCVPLSSPRFDPAACLAECAALSARREGPTRLDPTGPAGPPWTRLDHPGPPWTMGGGPEVGELKSPVSAIAPLCSAIRGGRAGLDHWTTLFLFLK